MKKNNTIDLIIIFSSLYKKRNTLFKTFILSIIISSIYSLTLSNQYKSTSTFYPHYDNEMTSNNLSSAKAIGQKIAERAIEAGIKKVVFDRSGYKYHGRIKAIAESAREAGLEF